MVSNALSSRERYVKGKKTCLLVEEVAQTFKDHGNEYFKGKRYREALGFYTQGIDAKPNDSVLLEVLLCNRAACNLELGKSSCPDSVRQLLTLFVARKLRVGSSRLFQGAYYQPSFLQGLLSICTRLVSAGSNRRSLRLLQPLFIIRPRQQGCGNGT